MVIKILNQQENNYYQSQIVDNKNNLKNMEDKKQAIKQNKINRNPGKFQLSNGTTSDPATIAYAFNNYFVNIGPTLASDILGQSLQYRLYM